MTIAPPSKAYYDKRAKEGYGLMYPDGHIIRIWETYLKTLFTEKHEAWTMLDFGCWNGTHATYFKDKGFAVAGVDIVEEPVRMAAQANKKYQEQFHVITDATNLTDLYNTSFDVILANQVLYFLDDVTLSKRLTEFDLLLKPDGFVVFTMMSRRNYFSRYSTCVGSNGLEAIKFPKNHRFAGKQPFVRFVESLEHLQSIFCKFESLSIGMYDVTLSIEDSAEHFIFIGRKLQN